MIALKEEMSESYKERAQKKINTMIRYREINQALNKEYMSESVMVAINEKTRERTVASHERSDLEQSLSSPLPAHIESLYKVGLLSEMDKVQLNPTEMDDLMLNSEDPFGLDDLVEGEDVDVVDISNTSENIQ